MSRWIRWIVAALLCAALMPLSGTAESTPPLSADDFSLAFEGGIYATGQPAAPLVTALEQAGLIASVQAVESCMFSGLDREYDAGNILIATYPAGAGGSDVIETILVQGGDWKTARGIGIGSTVSEVEAAYGTAYIQDYDQMIFPLGDPATEPVLIFVLALDTGHVTTFYMMHNATP